MVTIISALLIFMFMASALALRCLFGKSTITSSCNGRIGLPCPANCKANRSDEFKLVHDE